jgi:hypothetical protein
MAKRLSVSARATARRQRGGPTFIQRSRTTSSEQKALYHNVLGAGRRGVLRPFFDLNAADQREAGLALEKLIDARLKTL